MNKETKVLIGIILGTLILLFGGVFLLSKNSSVEEPQGMAQIAGLEASPETYDLGDVPINGGVVSREYELKNTTGQAVVLKKVTTSCMCTTATVEVGDKKTKAYGMEMPGDKNPILNIEIPTGESAKITTFFDPAAHGPNGTGPFDREVWFTFADPGGLKTIKFNGVVVK